MPGRAPCSRLALLGPVEAANGGGQFGARFAANAYRPILWVGARFYGRGANTIPLERADYRMSRQVEVHLRGGDSIFVSETDGSRIQEALSRGLGAVDVRELGGNRTVINIGNVTRLEFHG